MLEDSRGRGHQPPLLPLKQSTSCVRQPYALQRPAWPRLSIPRRLCSHPVPPPPSPSHPLLRRIILHLLSHTRVSPSQALLHPLSDVYSFDVLTKKTPFKDLVEEHDIDIPRWVYSVREEQNNSGEDPGSSENKAFEKKLRMLLNITVVCIAIKVEKRLSMREML
ncbi:hypothetical protein GW17_00006490 [Ensete ventricosum]|nr:hypothetical protein GW17_00006490 [Ensete ventricosum]